MNKNTFVDTSQIHVKAGNGGDGLVSFRREKYIAKGGPNGGDGGDGGDVILKATSNMATLLDFRSKALYEAQSGGPGGSEKMSGKNGGGLVVRVPRGTLVYEVRGGAGGENILIGDLVSEGQGLRVARGGKGGKGNDKFKSSTNRTPRQFTRGIKGEEKTLKLEIKLIADIGLVGLPNAGKSTLINRLAGINARVADYPFTTLNPNLGVAELKNGNKVIVADIPGLIEGASEGKGLGDDFLRHIERTRLIVHLIDPFSFDEDMKMDKIAVKNYQTIRQELENYGANLSKKKEIVVINKVEIPQVQESFDEIKAAFDKMGVGVLGISALSGIGIEALINKLTKELEKIPVHTSFDITTPTKVYTINDLPNKRIVFRGNKGLKE